MTNFWVHTRNARTSIRTIYLSFLFITLFASNAIAATKNIAIILTNSNYNHITQELTQSSFARSLDVSSALEAEGFAIHAFKNEANRVEIADEISRLKSSIDEYGEVVIYFSGINMTFDGQNFLLASRSNPSDPGDLIEELRLGELIELMERRASSIVGKITVILLDLAENKDIVDNYSRALAAPERSRLAYAPCAEAVTRPGTLVSILNLVPGYKRNEGLSDIVKAKLAEARARVSRSDLTTGFCSLQDALSRYQSGVEIACKTSTQQEPSERPLCNPSQRCGPLASVWEDPHGARLSLTQSGNNIRIEFTEPGRRWLNEGAEEGMPYFTGTRDCSTMVGKKYAYASFCLQGYPFVVDTEISQDNRVITFRGSAPTLLTRDLSKKRCKARQWKDDYELSIRAFAR